MTLCEIFDYFNEEIQRGTYVPSHSTLMSRSKSTGSSSNTSTPQSRNVHGSDATSRALSIPRNTGDQRFTMPLWRRNARLGSAPVTRTMLPSGKKNSGCLCIECVISGIIDSRGRGSAVENTLTFCTASHVLFLVTLTGSLMTRDHVTELCLRTSLSWTVREMV